MFNEESKTVPVKYENDSGILTTYTQQAKDFLDNAPVELWDRIAQIGEKLYTDISKDTMPLRFMDKIGRCIFTLDKLSQSSNKELQEVGQEVSTVLVKSEAQRLGKKISQDISRPTDLQPLPAKSARTNQSPSRTLELLGI